MPFSDDQINQMQRIFWRIEPQTISSVQFYDDIQKYRTCCSFAVINQKREVMHVFQNFSNLTPARWKIIDNMKRKIPFDLASEEIGNGIIRIGWKFE